MAIIQKRADELKPGDVFKRYDGRRVSVLGVEGRPHGVCLRYIHLGNDASVADSVYSAATDMLDVEVPDLTPAQQHAEELAELVRATSRMGVDTLDQANLRDRCRAVLDKIDPPEPPALAEALASLKIVLDCEAAGAFLNSEHKKQARDILDRARRANLI